MLALGLGGFVAMDMVGAASKASGNQFTIGQVNGEKLDWNEFQRAERILYPNATGDVYGQRNYIWNYMVCLLYTSPSPRDRTRYRMPSSA